MLEFNESQWLKPYIQFNTHKRIKAGKNGDKDGKALSKFMNNTRYEKTMENLGNEIDVSLVNNEKVYIKCTSKKSHKIFDNNLVAIRKNKFTLMLNKSAYIGKCILELSKVIIQVFHYDSIKNKYDNKLKLSFTNADSQCMKLSL